LQHVRQFTVAKGNFTNMVGNLATTKIKLASVIGNFSRTT
jgi:hypothetical protein